MSLKERIQQLGPDGDSYLASVWKSFQGTEAHEALAMEVQTIQAQAQLDVTDPRASAELRAHAAGRLHALETLDRVLHFAFNWEPPPAEPPQEDEETEEEKDVVY